MTIVEMLQSDDGLARVTCGWRWLCGDGFGNWTVYERKPHAKKTQVVIETKDEARAVACLAGTDDAPHNPIEER